MVIYRIRCTSKILTYLCFTKQRLKTKNTFAKYFCKTIEFKNYFKQIPVLFKTYADFERSLKSVESYEGSHSKTYLDHIPCSFAYKLLCADDESTKPIVV